MDYFILSYQVDEEMRQELAELKLSVDKEKGAKAKANPKVSTLKSYLILLGLRWSDYSLN